MDTERVARAYTWHNENDIFCMASALYEYERQESFFGFKGERTNGCFPIQLESS